jgi:hypothetical protein
MPCTCPGLPARGDAPFWQSGNDAPCWPVHNQAKARKGGANPGSWRCCGRAPSGRADGIVDRGFLGTMGPGEEEVTPIENVEEPDA